MRKNGTMLYVTFKDIENLILAVKKSKTLTEKEKFDLICNMEEAN